jgi:hypothetical protein
MSEYQYYEFQAIDGPLDRTAQQALRSLSSRARITATSFTNHYDFGDFGGDPRKLMEQWFDLHLYLANWGTRRLMLRMPKRLLDRTDIAPFLAKVDCVEVWTSGDNLIVDIHRGDDGLGDDERGDDWFGDDGDDDGSAWLAGLAPLRADVLSGDLRLFYLLWLTAVQDDLVSDDELEPQPGIGPLTSALEAFAEFFGINPDLIQAAAERSASDAALSTDHMREVLAAISEVEKTDLLLRLVEGDGHVAAELKRRIRQKHPAPTAPYRTVAALRMRARQIGEERERAAAERREAETRRQAEEAEKARRARLEGLKRQGVGVWREIEGEIERRNAPGYDRAASLLADLQVLAVEERTQSEFAHHLAAICVRHENKRKFIERLTKLGLEGDERTA